MHLPSSLLEVVANLVGLKQKTISAFENKPEGIKLEILFHILSADKEGLTVLAQDKLTTGESQWHEEW